MPVKPKARRAAKKAPTPAREPRKQADHLNEYAAKRDFGATTEPRGKVVRPRTSRLHFVVQKHDATRLHFDLRLELGGVLKSWAVTRGPSMKPGVRRLAVQTEDHPMAYKDWEGTIPKGEYGGGTMIVWDRGTWTPEGDPDKELAAGKLSFALDGERLRGAWTLVRMKDEGKRHNWLLIKRSDTHAIAGEDVEPVDRLQKSAISGRTNADLVAQPVLWPDHKARASKPVKSRASTLSKLPGARKGILPHFVEPSLATSAAEPPRGSGWIHEIKHDGYRIQARLDGKKVKLLTRKGLDWSKRFPGIVKAVATLPVKAALLDGEIIAQNEAGHSSFADLQADLKGGRHDRLAYFVFDILYCDGVDLRGVAVEDRKRLLAELAGQPGVSAIFRYNSHLDESEDDILVHACRLGLEGIVSKRLGSAYVSGRGQHWLKSKCMLRQEFVIAGFLESNDRKSAVGSLVLAYYDEGGLVHAGRAGTGYSAETSRNLYELLRPLKIDKPRFRTPVSRPAAKGVIWVKPEVVAEIEYRGRTTDGLLRQAAYAGLREDKPASEVTLEQSASLIPQHAPPARAVEVSFTHPDRILWDDAGVTKQALANYYTNIAEWILPHVQGRVVSLLRCPGGTAEKCFFAKHAWMGLDPSVKLVDIGDEKPMLMVNDLRGLLELVQMNVLEIHVWGSRAAHLDRPDRLVFDLDPGDGVAWPDVRNAAVELRQRLEQLGLRSFVKTTGGKGLHVVVPVRPDVDWDFAKAWCKAFAQQMAQDSPARYVATMTKSRRAGRIFIDYLRNGRGATAVAPYSTRARPGAAVATPLDWTELGAIGSAAAFTLQNVEQRLANLSRDPWEDMMKVKQALPR